MCFLKVIVVTINQDLVILILVIQSNILLRSEQVSI